MKLLGMACGGMYLAACNPNDPDEPQPGPDVVATTPYTLTLPANLPQNVQVPANNSLTQEGVQLGRMLFYEPLLSRTGTQSCGTCHQQSKAFTDGRARALGVDGAEHPRNTMSLANVLWEKTLNWDGAATSLEQQARLPIENPLEMHQSLAEGVRKLQQTERYPPLFRKAFGSASITEDNVLKALAQFERTLISANSRFDKYIRKEGSLTPTERAGAALFNNHPGENGLFIRGGACHHCHISENGLFNSDSFFNNGLDVSFTDLGRAAVTKQAADRGKFRAPSLRNIALTAPYMHDGRFQTLEQVLDHYNEHVRTTSPGVDPNVLLSNTPGGTRLDLTATEKRQLLAFLHTLTDSTFITDKRFSDPFKE
ncbi:cytochrome-c peroxidase [Hymenobacter weizhouensis]|uniref:cytochrome-c peroxidase n=1 Tax=Hymenobacter sp. YIM 151500-1 TaxID=2987689 RepID=UPI002226526D|nr:cytochrome c peroxidase [Hymenobacter sp. YIM 151500-1]UYZ64813.1 cytochrome-c peroxidase [Hymenobacter sp. YIM 151500-1]